MPWVVGIDEAGYGPNLGPLVMTSVACRAPRALLGGDWWSVLRPAVRRHFAPEDGRLVVEDSKLVYSPNRGLLDLETGVLAILSPQFANDGVELAPFLDWLCPTSHERLRGEPWYTGTSRLPVQVEAERCREAAARVR